jgi:hypothetical protein
MIEEARAEAVRVGSAAREEAQQRIAEARAAADDALGDARAVSEGLRKLGDMLGGHSERILRDVSTAHRELAQQLRVASGNASARASGGRAEQNGGNGEPEGDDRPRRGRLEGLEPPSWIDE